MKRLILAIIGAGLLSTTAAVAENVLTNASFEVPVLSSGSQTIRNGGNPLPGWTVGPIGSVYLVRGQDIFSAPHGDQYVDFNGAGVTLSQSFGTVTGEVYEVTFIVGYFQSTNSSMMRLSAQVTSETGEPLASLTVPAPNQRGWGNPSRFRFIPKTPRSTLTFTDTTGTVNFDLTLDHVSVERVTPRLSIACSQVRLCWESQINRLYQLQARPDFVSPWTDFGNPIPGTGTNCVTEEITDTRRFFRAVTLP